MADKQAAVPDPTTQLDTSRRLHAGEQYTAVQDLFWRQTHGKRSAPTPVNSGLDTPAEREDETMEEPTSTTTPSLLQPFSLQNNAALEVTVAALGVNPNDHNAVQAWLNQPVQNNRELFATMRAYHEQVIRPECYALIVQLETGLKTLNNHIFQVRKELSWMSAENRLAQKYACGPQLLTTGWPQGLAPGDREYQIGWMISQTPKTVTFLYDRGHLTDFHAHETKRYLNALVNDPVTVPAGGDFYSAMTLLTFKAYELRSAFLERFGGSTGTPVYKDERTQVKGHHIKVAPCSPQWQRKLESPLRVLLSCINSHPDHNSASRIIILWKTLTLMAPTQGEDFQEDLKAWARLFYYEDNGEFKGRLEVAKDLEKILMAPPTETTAPESSLWAQMWNKVQWGNQWELDQAESAAITAARSDAAVSGKGLNLGKGKRHWSAAAVHTNYYEPYPFSLEFMVVDSIYFSWDEFCEKCKKDDAKIGDPSIATVQGKPPAPIVADLQATQTAQHAKSSAAPPPTTTPKGSGRGRGSKGQAA